MNTHVSPSLTLAQAFDQFLEVFSFARRTRESYTEDLAPLFAECGQVGGILVPPELGEALDGPEAIE